MNDYDIYDGSEETLDNLPPGGLTERMKVLENRFKEIQWDLDTVIQQEDDKDLNGTREELEQLNYKVDLIETQLEKHGYSHIQTTLEGNFPLRFPRYILFDPFYRILIWSCDLSWFHIIESF